MLFTHFKIALRNAFKSKSIVFLNITNLGIGLASAMTVYLFLWGAFHVDSFHKNIKQTYQIKGFAQSKQQSYVSGATSALLAEAIKNEIPEIQEACRIMQFNGEELLGYLNNNVREKGFFVDPSFFKIFTIPLKYGNPLTVLEAPNSIVISESVAKKLFQEENPVNNSINIYSINNETPEIFTITGVFNDIKEPSVFNCKYLIPFTNYVKNHPYVNSWGNIGTRTWVMVQPDANPELIANKITTGMHERFPDDNNIRPMLLQPFENSHLYEGSKSPGNYGFVYYVLLIVGIIGILILFVSVINFINLTTAWSVKRAKEVGIRKVTGAGRKTLVLQFLLETSIIVGTATILSIILTSLGIYSLNKMMDNLIQVRLNNIPFILGILIIIIFTILSAGWFPALYLSRYSPVKVLKNGFINKNNKNSMRKILVITQFILAIFLIISTIVLKKQVDCIANNSHGYDRYNIVCFKKNKSLNKHNDAFIEDLEKKSEIKSITFSGDLPINVNSSQTSIIWANKDPLDNTFLSYTHVDQKYCQTLGIKLIAGNDFSQENKSPHRTVLVNDTAARYMKLQNPIGEKLKISGTEYEIAGIVEDFQHKIMMGRIAPLFIIYYPSNTAWCMVKLDSELPSEGLEALKDVYNKYSPDFPFNYTFLDTEFNTLHKALFNSIYFMYYCSAFAILIACLGLLGLTLFIAERKIKEIGVRKVNGARTINILTLIINPFISQVLIAFIIASPIAYLLMNKVLQFFTYKEPINWKVFAMTLIFVLILVVITIGWQCWRAARRNPLEAMRYE